MASPLCAPPIVTDRVSWSVGLSVGLSPSKPCKSGRSDRDAVCVDDSGGPRESPVAYSEPLRANTVLCSFNTKPPSSLTAAVCLSPATPLHHLHTHPLLLQHLLIYPLLHMFLNLKSSRSCLTALTSNLILIISPLGFSRNAHLFLSLQSLTSSTSVSPLASFTQKNLLLLLKKSTLDKDELSNYRPVCNLSVIYKIIIKTKTGFSFSSL